MTAGEMQRQADRDREAAESDERPWRAVFIQGPLNGSVLPIPQPNRTITLDLGALDPKRPDLRGQRATYQGVGAACGGCRLVVYRYVKTESALVIAQERDLARLRKPGEVVEVLDGGARRPS